MSKDLTLRIQALQKKKEHAQQQISRLKGRREQILKQLKTEFDCDSEEEAKEKLDSLTKDIDRRRVRLERKVTELEEQIDG